MFSLPNFFSQTSDYTYSSFAFIKNFQCYLWNLNSAHVLREKPLKTNDIFVNVKWNLKCQIKNNLSIGRDGKKHK